MTRIYLPSQGAANWQRLLADPVKHWRDGYSAKSLAERWEDADGLPSEIASLFRPFGKPELLLALPEHKVALPGARRGESQTDLFALIRAGDQVFATAIEGKVDEPFGPLVRDWLVDASPGKRERIDFLQRTLGLAEVPGDVHYQLLHRSVSALIEAKRFGANGAAMVVHSFSPTGRWFDAFERFAGAMGVSIGCDQLGTTMAAGERPLHLAWASGYKAGLIGTLGG